jgi:hypothetical protein
VSLGVLDCRDRALFAVVQARPEGAMRAIRTQGGAKKHLACCHRAQIKRDHMAQRCGCCKTLLGSKLFSQILLLAINGMVFIGGIVMVYFSASKRISSPTSTFLCTGGSSSVLSDPLVLVISFGSVILFIAALGMIGACCRSSK